MREVRRGEINIITVKDKETLLVHEKKEAVDLTQYILQVWYFPSMKRTLSSVKFFVWVAVQILKFSFEVWVLAFILCDTALITDNT